MIRDHLFESSVETFEKTYHNNDHSKMLVFSNNATSDTTSHFL